MTDDERKKAETKEKLRAFLRSGHHDDVSSILVHTLMSQAESKAAKPAPKKPRGKR